ncbi:uncharacterized protein METZ01_LOCUS350120, partial [marine metagenome]
MKELRLQTVKNEVGGFVSKSIKGKD